MPDYIVIPYMVCYNIEKERTWNMLKFDEHFWNWNVHKTISG